MVKHSYASFIRIISLIVTTCLITAFTFATIISFVLPSSLEAKLFFISSIVGCSIFQWVIIELIAILVSKVGKKTITISKSSIESKNVTIKIRNSKLFYSKINFRNVLELHAGKLVVIVNGNEEPIGWFTKREIKQIMELVPNIRII